MKKLGTVILAALALAGCSQTPDGRYSLRQTIADAGGPGTGPAVDWAEPSGPPAGQITSPQVYVAVYGGQVRIKDQWLPLAHDVVYAQISECATLNLGVITADMNHRESYYVTLVRGVVYVSAHAAGAACAIPYPAVAIQNFGRWKLDLKDKFRNGVVSVWDRPY